MSDLSQIIDFIRKEFNHSLKYFPLPESPKYLYNPIKYSLKSKGKRYRPIIIHLAGRSFKSDPDELMKISLGIELLHNFTLIHDELWTLMIQEEMFQLCIKNMMFHQQY